MAPIIVPAAIAAGSAIAGAVMGGKGAKGAAETQLQGTREALAFQQRQENDRKAAYDKSVGQYEQQVAAWNANRSALAERYGIDIGEPSGGLPGGQPVTPGQTPGLPQTATLGDLAASKAGGLGGWDKWSSYGLGGQANG